MKFKDRPTLKGVSMKYMGIVCSLYVCICGCGHVLYVLVVLGRRGTHLHVYVLTVLVYVCV